jgi:hypothetical protein
MGRPSSQCPIISPSPGRLPLGNGAVAQRALGRLWPDAGKQARVDGVSLLRLEILSLYNGCTPAPSLATNRVPSHTPAAATPRPSACADRSGKLDVRGRRIAPVCRDDAWAHNAAQALRIARAAIRGDGGMAVEILTDPVAAPHCPDDRAPRYPMPRGAGGTKCPTPVDQASGAGHTWSQYRGHSATTPRAPAPPDWYAVWGPGRCLGRSRAHAVLS